MSELLTEIQFWVTKQGNEYVAECDHGEYIWTIHRSTGYLARRSLEAHLRHEPHRPSLSTSEGG